MAETCTWATTPDPDCEFWETDCGEAFNFETGGPKENKMKFCCYCGRPLTERVDPIYEEEDRS